jgi:hypothetical protein
MRPVRATRASEHESKEDEGDGNARPGKRDGANDDEGDGQGGEGGQAGGERAREGS